MTQTLSQATEYDKLFIGGRWAEPSTDQVIEVHCPATGEYVGKVPLAASVINCSVGTSYNASSFILNYFRPLNSCRPQTDF